MYGYAASSAAATKVDQFSAPAQMTSQSGLAAQSAAVGQSIASSTGAGAQSTLSQTVSAVPGALQSLSSPTAVTGASSGLDTIASALGLQPGDVSNAVTNLASGMMTPYSLAGITQVGSDIAVLRGAFLTPHDPLGLGTGLGAGLGGAPLPGAAGLRAFGPAGLGGAGAVSAGMGQGTLVGSLSVPQGWAAASPVSSPSTATSLVSSWTAAPEAGAAGTPGVPGMPVVSGGRNGGFVAPRYGFRPTVMAHPPAAG